jgi:hypothetical protein
LLLIPSLEIPRIAGEFHPAALEEECLEPRANEFPRQRNAGRAGADDADSRLEHGAGWHRTASMIIGGQMGGVTVPGVADRERETIGTKLYTPPSIAGWGKMRASKQLRRQPGNRLDAARRETG